MENIIGGSNRVTIVDKDCLEYIRNVFSFSMFCLIWCYKCYVIDDNKIDRILSEPLKHVNPLKFGSFTKNCEVGIFRPPLTPFSSTSHSWVAGRTILVIYNDIDITHLASKTILGVHVCISRPVSYHHIHYQSVSETFYYFLIILINQFC